jgi:hypothetical protein
MAIEAHGQKISIYNLEDGLLFTVTLNGNINSEQMQFGAKNDPKIGLTQDEKILLRPFFDRLKNIEVNEVSDVLLVLDEIPGNSESINALKQLISDAAFATNPVLYAHIINQ